MWISAIDKTFKIYVIVIKNLPDTSRRFSFPLKNRFSKRVEIRYNKYTRDFYLFEKE